jgi:hypothetical protein
MTFIDLVNEVKQRAIRNQSGTYFDETIKNIINTSLFRIARESKWKCLRRKSSFNTITSYMSGTNFATVTNSSTAISISATACDLWVDKIEVGRSCRLGSSSWYYNIKAINSNTNFVIDIPYRGTTASATTLEIYPQSEYNLPIQVDHRSMLWHEDFGYPYRMFYIPDQTFLDTQVNLNNKNTPTHYRMWGENSVLAQPPTATPLVVTWSSSTDITAKITIFGNVGGYPNFEVLTVGNSKTTLQFESVERVAKDKETYGTLTLTSSRGSYTVSVLPAGDTLSSIKYSKVQLYPLPYRAFPINVYYYKDPYRLVNDTDVHELGQEFDEVIVLLSVAKLKLQDSQEEGDRWLVLYADEISNLKKYNIDKPDWTPILQRPKQDRTDPFVVKNLLYRQAGPQFGPQSRP